MSDINVLIVWATGETEERSIDPTLEVLQGLVGGPIEVVSPPASESTPDWHAYCNEEGKIHSLPFNRRATNYANYLGWPRGDVLCGPVVFLGDGPDGGDADIPAETLALMVEIDRVYGS